MKKALFSIALFALCGATSVSAQNNVGSCGLGSKVFDGQKGIVPQVLAVTTNGSFGSQTFGITSGTSGCTSNGVVSSSWKTALFIDSNMNRLAKDMSVGEGETLASLATLLGVADQDRPVFYAETQKNFAAIFPNTEVTSQEVARSINSVLAQNSALVQYAAQS
jgi:hypothetical protein